MHLDGIHYSPNCSCESCKRIVRNNTTNNSMLKKYRLLRDCPHGKEGSIWVKVSTRKEYIQLRDIHSKEILYFPMSNLLFWFEEIVGMPKFTKEQAEAIKDRITRIEPGKVTQISDSNYYEISKILDSCMHRDNALLDWLDENTEE